MKCGWETEFLIFKNLNVKTEAVENFVDYMLKWQYLGYTGLMKGINFTFFLLWLLEI